MQVEVEVKPENGTYFVDGRISCQFTGELARGATCSYDIAATHRPPGGGGSEQWAKDTGEMVDCQAPRFPPVEGQCLYDDCRGSYDVDARFDIRLQQGWAWLPRGEDCVASGVTENELGCEYFYRNVDVN